MEIPSATHAESFFIFQYELIVEIVIHWLIHRIRFHTNIKKMYNSVKLIEEDWCLQQYLWLKVLDQRKLPEENAIKTLIHGVKSSGNQA